MAAWARDGWCGLVLPEPDVALVKLTMLPIGMARYGDSTPVCGGAVLGTGAVSWPAVGDQEFAVSCTNAPPGASGWLVLAAAPAATPVPLAGARVWVDPSSVQKGRNATADALGFSEVHLPIPALPHLAGKDVYAQFLWPDPCRPGELAATGGLHLRIQKAGP